MSSTHEPPDDLLDAVIARLKSQEVPEYPGPPRLDGLHDAGASESAQPARLAIGGLAVAASVTVLAFVTLSHSPVTKETQREAKSTPVVHPPTDVHTVDVAAQLTALESEADLLAERLDEIEEKIVRQELQRQAARLLAAYPHPQQQTP